MKTFSMKSSQVKAVRLLQVAPTSSIQGPFSSNTLRQAFEATPLALQAAEERTRVRLETCRMWRLLTGLALVLLAMKLLGALALKYVGDDVVTTLLVSVACVATFVTLAAIAYVAGSAPGAGHARGVTTIFHAIAVLTSCSAMSMASASHWRLPGLSYMLLPCERAVTTQWIAVVLTASVVFKKLPFSVFAPLSQLVALQHLACGIAFRRQGQQECDGWSDLSPSDTLRGIFPLVLATVQLQLLCALLTVASWSLSADAELVATVARFSRTRDDTGAELPGTSGNPSSTTDLHADAAYDTNKQVRSGLEVLVAEWRDEELRCRRLYANLGNSSRTDIGFACTSALGSMIARMSEMTSSFQAHYANAHIHKSATWIQPRRPSLCSNVVDPDFALNEVSSDECSQEIHDFLQQSFMRQATMEQQGQSRRRGSTTRSSTESRDECPGVCENSGAREKDEAAEEVTISESSSSPSSAHEGASLPPPQSSRVCTPVEAKEKEEADDEERGQACLPTYEEPGDGGTGKALVSPLSGCYSSSACSTSLPFPLPSPSWCGSRGIGEWGFDALALDAECGSCLQVVGHDLCRRHSLFKEENLIQTLRVMASGYPAENPYHTEVHAADVCSSVYNLCQKLGIWDSDQFDDTNRAAVLLAALGHDIAHGGFNNGFLIATRHALATTYNDRSVLENHHCSTLIRILDGDVGLATGGALSACLLEHFTREEYGKVRHLIIALILATDTQYHLSALSEFRVLLNMFQERSAFEAANEPDPMNHSTEKVVLMMLFRAADIGHTAKLWTIHQAWSFKVVEEFHRQGDEEQRRGLPISPLCRRDGYHHASSQLGFIDFVCLPTWVEVARAEVLLQPSTRTPSLKEAWVDTDEKKGESWRGLQVCLHQCEVNHQEWKKRAEQEQQEDLS